MAILFMDGFDAYGTGASQTYLTRWASATGNFTNTVSTTVTPAGAGQSFSATGNLANSLVTSPKFTATSTFTVGFNFYATRMDCTAGSFLNTSSMAIYMLSDATYMMGLQVNQDGSISVARTTSTSAGAFLGTTTTGLIKKNTWHYIELSVSISDTVGTVSVSVDGATVLSLSNQDTRNGTPTTVNTLVLGNNGGTYTLYFDDIYVSDSTTPLGPQRILTLRPNLDTAQKDWVALSGANNSAMVGETTTDADTSYVQGSLVGNYDLYDAANTSVTNATISCVNHVVWARKTDATARAITLTTKSGSTTTDSTNQTIANTYAAYSKTYDTDPATSAAWTISGVNALQIGQKVAV